MTERLRILASFAAVYVIWGSTYTAIAVAIRDLPPLRMAGVRWLLAGAILYAVSRLRGAPRPRASEWRRAAIAGAFLVAGTNGLVSWAESRVPSGLAAMILTLSPLLVVVLEWLGWGGARPTGRTWLGLAAGFGGVAVLVGPIGGAPDAAAVLGLVLAASSWAVGTLYTRHAPDDDAKSALTPAIQMLAGGAILSVAGAARGEAFPDRVSIDALLAVAYLVVFGSLVAFGAYVYLVRRVSPGAIATHSFVNPVIAVALGWALLGEALDATTLVGAVLVVAAVAMIASPRGAPPRFARGHDAAPAKLARAEPS